MRAGSSAAGSSPTPANPTGGPRRSASHARIPSRAASSTIGSRARPRPSCAEDRLHDLDNQACDQDEKHREDEDHLRAQEVEKGATARPTGKNRHRSQSGTKVIATRKAMPKAPAAISSNVIDKYP